MLLVLISPPGVDNAVRRDAEFEVVAVGGAGTLLFDGLEVTAALAADDLLPVDADQEFLELRRGHAGGVAAANERAHAGAGDAVDGDVHFFQHLEHADVRAALRAAAGEHRPMRGRLSLSAAAAQPEPRELNSTVALPSRTMQISWRDDCI